MSTSTNYGFDLFTVGETGWGPTASANFSSIDSEIAKPRIIHNAPTVSGTTTCDLSLARVFAFTVSQATTLAFTNVPSSSFFVRTVLLITNGSAFTLTFPASVTWLYGGAPTLQASGVDVVELVTKDGGTMWYARLLNGGYSRIGTATAAARPTLTLYLNHSLQTTSTSEVSLASYSLPANALSVNGARVRITMFGRAVTQQGVPTVDFGATEVGGGAVAAGENFRFEVTVVRTGAATQISSELALNGTTIASSRATPAETLSGAVTIDFRGSVTSGGTLHIEGVSVELLAS